MSERPDTWMPIYWADYFADTGDLGALEHGAYLCLIGHYWRKGPPADDDARLARIARCTASEWRRVRPIIVGFFRISEGLWRHSRVDREWERALSNRDQKSAAGRASAAQRAKQRGAIGPSTDVATEGQREGNSSSSSSPSSVKEPKGSSGVARRERQPAAHLPLDWKPDAALRDYAAQLGLSPADIERDIVKFVAYFTDGDGSTQRRNQRGWRSSWHRWVAKTAGRLPPAARAQSAEAPKPGTDEYYRFHNIPRIG